MISGWLVKIIVVIALVGAILVEVGSPVITRISLDSNAHDAANNAATELTQTHDAQKAQTAAQTEADNDGAKLEKFDIDAQGVVRVTLFKQAKSYVLHNFEQTRSWYDVRVSASAASSR